MNYQGFSISNFYKIPIINENRAEVLFFFTWPFPEQGVFICCGERPEPQSGIESRLKSFQKAKSLHYTTFRCIWIFSALSTDLLLDEKFVIILVNYWFFILKTKSLFYISKLGSVTVKELIRTYPFQVVWYVDLGFCSFWWI